MIKFTHGLLMGVSVLCAGSMTAHAQDITLSTSSPYQVESRVNYGASIRSCKAALIAPSWVLTARHCLGSKKVNNIKKHGKVTFTVTDEDGVNRQVVHNSKALFKHPFKDIGLLQLEHPVSVNLIEPVVLLGTPLLKKHGVFKMKKVSRIKSWSDIPVRAGRYNNAFVSKPNRRGGAGTSGAAWVFESDYVGDVLFAVTHGTGRAAQTAYVRKWIDETVSDNDPDAELVWVSMASVFPERL